MNASVEWLSAFADTGLPPTAIANLLTARAATVDAVEPLRADLAGVVVGRVVEAARHPDSDHLWVTRVDAGGGTLLDVVCGAPNVTVGTRYPFAPVGTTMPNGMRIERRKIRGQLSNGMLCSARELGLGVDQDGILPLETEAAPGTPLLNAIPAGDTRLVIDVLPNRPDLLSHYGVAREIAAATGVPLRFPALPVGEDVRVPAPQRVSREGTVGGVRVTVDSDADCPAYLTVVVRGVRIGPSPEWLVQRLAGAGLRSVSNLVDITNYLLHGYGQPVHAFDLARLAGNSLRVRRAAAHERIVTLDGVARSLDPQMLVIADSGRPQAIAGVMGGHDSEIRADTTDVVLEVAAFAPERVRATRRALALATDASYRFERLVPATSPIEAVVPLVTLVVALTGGAVVDAPLVVGPAPVAKPPLPLRTRRVAQVLGVDVPASESAPLLESVGFTTRARDADLLVSAPAWRTDIGAEIDLVEEVARLRGYDSFPKTLRPYRPGTVPDDPLVKRSDELRELLVGRGFLEVRPMPFVSAGSEDADVRVTNPLTEQEALLRGELLSSLARRAEFNLAHMEGNLRLFEIGTAFRARPGETRPREEVRVAALCMGARRPPHFTDPNPPQWDEWDAKGLGESLAELVAVRPATLTPDGHGSVLWRITVDGDEIGRIRRVPLDAPPWAAPAYGVEVRVAVTEIEPVAPPGAHAPENGDERRGERRQQTPAERAPKYNPPPAQPAVRVDVTLLVPPRVSAGDVEQRLRSAREGLLERVELINEYRGPELPPGHRSLTWRLTFRHPERTLREKEVEARRDNLLRALESDLGVRPRTA
jgi:phenylalanyl-tRNA synthetase beta chain